MRRGFCRADQAFHSRFMERHVMGVTSESSVDGALGTWALPQVAGAQNGLAANWCGGGQGDGAARGARRRFEPQPIEKLVYGNPARRSKQQINQSV